MSERDDVVRRALGYPYRAARRPFVLAGELMLDPAELAIDTSERATLLAYGSNMSTGTLVRKLAENPDPVLVEPTWLEGFDAVYSAHLSPYGAVPATLQSSPGTSVRAAFVHLTDEQVECVSASEPNYELTRAWGCRFDQGFGIGEMQTYLSHHGCLVVDGSEVAVAGAEAKGRRFTAMSEPEVLEWVRDFLCPELSLEDFITSTAADAELAAARSDALASLAKEPSLPRQR